MSKKMMKRSLALGALMAFVITGNALAAEQLIVQNSDENINLSSNTEWYHTSGSSKYIYHDVSGTGNTITFEVTSGNAYNVDAEIRGGYSTVTGSNAEANSNIVILKDGITTNKGIYAGRAYVSSGSGNASANNNIVKLNGIKSSDYIYGGYASVLQDTDGVNVNANYNTVMVAGSSEVGYLYAGYAVASVKLGDALASSNCIEISGDTKVSKNIYTAYASGKNATASSNTLTINGNVNINNNRICNVYIEATKGTGSAINNVINISGDSNINVENIYSAYLKGVGTIGTYTANNNIINISENSIVNASEGIYGAYVIGSPVSEQSTENHNIVVNAEGNAVNISGGTVSATNIYGTRVEAGVDSKIVEGVFTTNAKNCEVNITGGSVKGNIYGGYATGEVANTDGNVVNISNVDVEGNVYGGYNQNEELIINSTNYGSSEKGTSNNNKVNINGGSIKGDVYAGYSENAKMDATISGSNVTTDVTTPPTPASNNTISLQGDVDVSNAKLYGNNGGQGTGNKLEVDESYSGDGKINTVGAFDEIEIDEMKYGETALDVENMNYKEADAQGNGGTKLTVNKMTMSGDQELSGELEIIKATNSNLKDENNQENGAISDKSSVTIYKGTSEIIEVGFGGEAGMELKEENIKKSVRNDQVLVIGESRAAATAFVNQGSEIIETGLDALARDNSKAGDTKVFAAVYGNASEYATGSHVKVNGWSGIVGVGKTNANGLTVGAFFENGEGNYRTYNTVDNDFMRGDGEANYNGGGFLIRKDNPNGVYTEASLRAGNLQNELHKAVRDSEGLAGYDVDTFYYGAHVGVGKIIPRGNKGDSIDVYGKFIYTHHDSESFDIDGSDSHFDSVDSERLRLGFRINEVQTNKLSMYYGAAWEYEFGGDADNTTVGYDLSTPSLGGSTMIGEIGMHYLASEKSSLDLNVRGYSGQRDGFTGSVQANYNF